MTLGSFNSEPTATANNAGLAVGSGLNTSHSICSYQED
jgi:hypothetical protein